MLDYWNKTDDAGEMSEQGEEVWVALPDCPSRYAVSNLGRVASVLHGKVRILRGTPVGKGYLSVGIYPFAGSSADTRLVHRVVVEAFLGSAPSPEHTDVRHLNGDGTDNVLHNLRWGTRSENMKDVIQHRMYFVGLWGEGGTSWYGGYTSDPHLVRMGLTFFAAGKLTIVDLSKLWNTSDDVAANIVRERRQRDPGVSVEVPAAKTRRTKEHQLQIEGLLMEGLTTSQVNERLGETLTAQEAHYYRSRAKTRTP